MSRELPSVVTPITYQAVINELLLAWPGTPTRKAVRLAACQIAIESGLKYCRAYNISGIKARAGGSYDWQYFATREFYTTAQLKDAIAKGPLKVIKVHDDGRTEVLLQPRHPYCCFRAFETLRAAVTDHITTLQTKFPCGWKGLLTGDASLFAEGLKHDRYYTAPQKDYCAGLAYRWAEALRAVDDASLVWGDVV